MSAQLVDWQEKEFNEALKAKSLSVIEFGAPWCGACKTTEPIIVELAKTYPNIKFAKVDVAKNPALASRMGVMSLPNILIVSEGKVLDQVIGAGSRAKIEEKIKKLTK